jgi:hypothetical protein
MHYHHHNFVLSSYLIEFSSVLLKMVKSFPAKPGGMFPAAIDSSSSKSLFYSLSFLFLTFS